MIEGGGEGKWEREKWDLMRPKNEQEHWIVYFYCYCYSVAWFLCAAIWCDGIVACLTKWFQGWRMGKMLNEPKQQTAVTVSAVEHQQRHKVFQNVSKIINFLNFLWTSLWALLFVFISILLKIIINNFAAAHWISYRLNDHIKSQSFNAFM